MSARVMSQSEIMEEFRAGVTACLRSWTALRAAVERGWGGSDSQAKADALRDHIYEIFDGSSNPPKAIEKGNLEDNLLFYLDEQFGVYLEDDSERGVTETLFQMYDGCYKGDVSLARQMVATAESAVAISAAYPVQVQSTEHDDDDDDDDDMTDTAESDGATSTMQQSGAMPLASAYASQSVFGAPPKPKKPVVAEVQRQLGSAPEQPQEVELDDEGFAPAKSKRKPRKPV
jgi:pre-rRNA-processing protein TSR2